MEFREKLERLLEHWVEHNKEHGESYRKWAEEAERRGFLTVVEPLRKAAEESEQINSLFEEALRRLNNE